MKYYCLPSHNKKHGLNQSVDCCLLSRKCHPRLRPGKNVEANQEKPGPRKDLRGTPDFALFAGEDAEYGVCK